jgi:hypothetical protein
MANTTSPHMARVHVGRNQVGVHSRIISNTHHQREPEGLVPSVIMGFSISSLLMAVGRCCYCVFILRRHGWSITSGELSVEYRGAPEIKIRFRTDTAATRPAGGD